jgi:hypothetical protein
MADNLKTVLCFTIRHAANPAHDRNARPGLTMASHVAGPGPRSRCRFQEWAFLPAEFLPHIRILACSVAVCFQYSQRHLHRVEPFFTHFAITRDFDAETVFTENDHRQKQRPVGWKYRKQSLVIVAPCRKRVCIKNHFQFSNSTLPNSSLMRRSTRFDSTLLIFGGGTGQRFCLLAARGNCGCNLEERRLNKTSCSPRGRFSTAASISVKVLMQQA